MIPQTDREVGPVDPHEVYQFQRRYGIKFDGRWGNQCQGQLGEIEAEYARVYALWLEASRKLAETDKPIPKCNPWGFLAGAMTAGVAWAMGALDWLHALVH